MGFGQTEFVRIRVVRVNTSSLFLRSCHALPLPLQTLPSHPGRSMLILFQFNLRTVLIALASLLLLTTAHAVEPGPEILLWPNGAPGSEGKTGDEKVRIADNGEHVLSNIHKPSITPYLPSGDKATGCAVLVAPGGGHRELWSDHEGHNVARWLGEHGIAAFVLKYRLARETNSTYTVDDHALAGMQRVLRLVRSRATEWGIITNRVGVMGFSAGGELAFLSAMRFDPGAADAT